MKFSAKLYPIYRWKCSLRNLKIGYVIECMILTILKDYYLRVKVGFLHKLVMVLDKTSFG
jgi:hypothetical protein